MSKPLIGISGSMNDAKKQIFLVRAYMQALLDADCIPVLLSPDMNEATIKACMDKLDGLMLAGGGDVEPRHFGEKPIAELGETTPERDAFELSILPVAIQKQIPVLGICRGVQVMNVALGGSLYQDLPAQYPARPLLSHKQNEPYETPSHSVTVAPSSLLGKDMGKTRLQVNSMHHQAVKEIAPVLTAVAYSDDGVVEALEHPSLPYFLGVQWHPERMKDHQALFLSFADAAKAYRRKKQ